jgi:hypothetical protein
LKYFTGILVLIVAFVPPILVAAKLKDWNMAEKQDVAIFVMYFLLLYTGSLAAYALVRQPIYAVVLAISVFLGGVILVPLTEGLWRQHNIDPENMMLFVYSVLVILSTIIAWQAVVRDWGWKRHR